MPRVDIFGNVLPDDSLNTMPPLPQPGSMGDYAVAPAAVGGALSSAPPTQANPNDPNSRAKLEERAIALGNPQPALWRQLLAGGIAGVLGRRRPQAAELFAGAITGSDPKVREAAQLKAQLGIADQQEQLDRLRQQTTDIAGYHQSAQRIAAAKEQENRQKDYQTALAGIESHGGEPLEGAPAPQAQPSPGTQPTVQAPAVPGAPPSLIPGLPPISPAQATAMTPPRRPISAPVNVPGSTTPQLRNPQTGLPETYQVPPHAYQLEQEAIAKAKATRDVAQAGWKTLPDDIAEAMSYPKGTTLPPADYTKVMHDFNRPEPRVGTPEQQFIDEYRAAHKGSSVADALKAYKQIQPPEKPLQAMMIDPTGKAVRVTPGMQVSEGTQTTSGFSSASAPGPTEKGAAKQGKIIVEAGAHLKQLIDANKDKIGNLESYWSQYINNSPIADPVVARIMAQLASYAALQPKLHGFRGQNALSEFTKIIGGIPKNPEALKAAIDGISDTAMIVANSNQRPGATPAAAAPATPAAPVVHWGRDANGNPVRLNP